MGRPPVFTAVENRRKRICFLHILLRIVAIMFKYLIMPSIATERLAKATAWMYGVMCSDKPACVHE